MAKTRDREGYAFNLHLVCGGFAYFSTLSHWIGKGEHYRDVRRPRAVYMDGFRSLLVAFGHWPSYIDSEEAYTSWLMYRGWAVVTKPFVRKRMPQWLNGRKCISDGLDVFTDVELASQGALSHSVSDTKRKIVIKRDGARCLECGRRPKDGIKLTMHHVRPFGHGGETTTRNLVCLCEECNQKVADEHVVEYFRKANLPYSIDAGLVRGNLTKDTFAMALLITKNMMHTRAEVV